ncbi:MAG: site-specific integrase, partial [Nitrososphaeria archaeon]
MQEPRALLQDRDVKRWYDNVARGSQVTADVYLRRLASFCRTNNLTPVSLLSLDIKKIQDILLDTVTDMENQGKAGSYIHSVIKAVRSWLSFNDIQISKKIKIRGVMETPTLKNERVPTQEELRRIFLSADPQQRVACVLMAHSGLRPETMGNYRGDDGLNVGDFPELVFENKQVNFTKMPAMVKVRSTLSKAGHEYFTFLTDEGCQYVKEYLESRMREGELIDGSSPLLIPKKDSARKKRLGSHITTTNIGDMVRKAIKNAGLSLRPYVLRSYFDTQLMIAESKGTMLRDYRTFFMGHKGDIENRYTTNKHRLPEDVIEDMRASYKNSSDLLRSYKKESLDQEQLSNAFKRQFLLVSGFSEEEIDKLDISKLSNEDIQRMYREKFFGTAGARQT